MKTILFVAINFFILSFTLLSGTDYKPKELDVKENCTEWIKSTTSDYTGIYFRWCRHEDDLKSFQFYNGYSYDIHMLYTIHYSDGSSFNGGTYIKAESNDDKASTGGKTPSRWIIRKVEKE